MTKIGDFALRKKERINMNGKCSKTLSSSNMDTKKRDKEEKAGVDFLVSKSLNVNSKVKSA